MHKLTLKRYSYSPTATEGRLYLDNKVLCYTLERPNKGNQRNVSCVTEGRYSVYHHNRPNGESALILEGGTVSQAPEEGKRYGILFHPGNSVSDSAGCVLPGYKRKQPEMVHNSKAAMYDLLVALHGQDVTTLDIISDLPDWS